MKRYVTSLLTGREYFHDDSIRILHIRQALYYLEHHVPLLDLYPSRSYQSGEKILVFVFDRRESIQIYNLWRLQKEVEKIDYLEDKEDEIRIIDIKQVITNMENKVIPKRIGPVKDYKGGPDLLAFYFQK